MDRAVGMLARYVKDRKGVTAIEYGLIACIISIASSFVVIRIGSTLADTYRTVASMLN